MSPHSFIILIWFQLNRFLFIHFFIHGSMLFFSSHFQFNDHNIMNRNNEQLKWCESIKQKAPYKRKSKSKSAWIYRWRIISRSSTRKQALGSWISKKAWWKKWRWIFWGWWKCWSCSIAFKRWSNIWWVS